MSDEIWYIMFIPNPNICTKKPEGIMVVSKSYVNAIRLANGSQLSLVRLHHNSRSVRRHWPSPRKG